MIPIVLVKYEKLKENYFFASFSSVLLVGKHLIYISIFFLDNYYQKILINNPLKKCWQILVFLLMYHPLLEKNLFCIFFYYIVLKADHEEHNVGSCLFFTGISRNKKMDNVINVIWCNCTMYTPNYVKQNYPLEDWNHWW